MAAPSSTKWSSVYGSGTHEAKLGIYYSTSSTTTSVSIDVEIWFWSEYTCYDQYNTLYFSIGEDVTSATANRGNVSINCTSSSQWSESNQKKIYSNTFTFDRYSTSRTIKMYAKLDTVEYIYKSPMYNNTSVTISPVTTYTIKYDANGGSGAPSSQTKTYGKTLTLRSAKPTRTGYNFKNWKVTADSGNVYYYNPGGTYTLNESHTLYAQWEKKTYTVKYDANGGSGAPSSQTKTYDVALTLSSTKPTRTGFAFKNWKSTQNGTVYYFNPGGTTIYNGDQTMYAQWERNTYTITYNANGGSGGPSSQTKSYGLSMAISSSKPTRSGYTFLGWHTSATADEPLYYAGGQLPSTFNVSDTLYAVWELEERVDIEILTTSVSVSGNHGITSLDNFGTLDWRTISGESGMNYYVSAYLLDNVGYERLRFMNKSGPYTVDNNVIKSNPLYYLATITKYTGNLNYIKLRVYVYTETTNGKVIKFDTEIPSQYSKPKILKAMPRIKNNEIEYSILIETSCYQPSDILADVRTPIITDDLGRSYTSTAVTKVSDKITEFKTTPVSLSDIGAASKLTITISDDIFQDKMTTSIPKIANTIDYDSINQKLSASLLMEDDSINLFEFNKGGVIRFKEYIESDAILNKGFSMGNNGIIASNICEK